MNESRNITETEQEDLANEQAESMHAEQVLSGDLTENFSTEQQEWYQGLDDDEYDQSILDESESDHWNLLDC